MADNYVEPQQCPNGHSSVGGGTCNVVGCAHVDPSVTDNSKNKGGISFGTARDHGVGRWAPGRK